MIAARSVEALARLSAVLAVISRLTAVGADVARPSRWAFAHLRVFVANSSVLAATKSSAFVATFSTGALLGAP
jgi:hypothetical protein